MYIVQGGPYQSYILLSGWYDNNNMSMKKIMVYIFSIPGHFI